MTVFLLPIVLIILVKSWRNRNGRIGVFRKETKNMMVGRWKGIKGEWDGEFIVGEG